MKATLLSVIALMLLAGCRMLDRHLDLDPEQNKVIRVESDERLYFELEENMTTGYVWQITSDNDDVDVAVEHLAPKPMRKGESMMCGAPGKAIFTIKVRRGFDGPATVRVFYQRSWEKEPIKSFVLSLYKSSFN